MWYSNQDYWYWHYKHNYFMKQKEINEQMRRKD